MHATVQDFPCIFTNPIKDLFDFYLGVPEFMSIRIKCTLKDSRFISQNPAKTSYFVQNNFKRLSCLATHV